MPRTARIVVPGIAYHVTHRGNRRQQTFFSDADYCRYVELVGEGRREAGVDVLAWCLMPNHVHLVLVPPHTGSLGAALALAQRSYTWIVNRRNGWQGHLWQNRFFSCPMDERNSGPLEFRSAAAAVAEVRAREIRAVPNFAYASIGIPYYRVIDAKRLVAHPSQACCGGLGQRR